MNALPGVSVSSPAFNALPGVGVSNDEFDRVLEIKDSSVPTLQ